MKRKFKPVAKLDIRERVEARFRARESLQFHLLLVFCALLLLLYNAYDFWVLSYQLQGFSAALGGYRDSITALCLLSTTAALHAIHFYFRHGRGRERHDAETDARIAEQLRHAAAEDAEEQEELVRLQMADKLKNRRLVLWHLALFLGVMSLLLFVHPLNVSGSFGPDAYNWRGTLTFAAVWGIGLGAHVLRYYFAYGFSREKREAQIEAQVARELRRDRRVQSAATASHVDEGGGISLADIERASQVTDSAAEKAP